MVVFLFLNLNLFAGPARVMTEKDFQNLKLPLIRVPSSLTFRQSVHEVMEGVTVSKNGLDYWIYENRPAHDRAYRMWINFRSDHDGNLISFRFGRGDNHFFGWSKEEGFSEKNEARVNLKKWIALYQKKVKFNRPIRFSED